MKRPLIAVAVGYIVVQLYQEHYDAFVQGVIALFVGAIVISFWRSVK